MGIGVVGSNCLMHWAVFINFLVKKHDLLQLKNTNNVEKKEAKRWKAKTIYRRERLHCCPSVGIWTLETLQDWSWTYGTLEKIFPKEASIEPWSIPGDNKIRRNVWLPTVWYQFCRNPRKTIWKFAAVYQKANVCRQYIGPIKHEYAAKQRLMSNHDEYWILALS